MDAPDRVGYSHSQTLGSSSLAGLGPTIAVPFPTLGPEGNSTYTSHRHSSPLSDQGDAPSPFPPLPGHDPFSHGWDPSQRSDNDWARPVVEKPAPRLKTVTERLDPTLDIAKIARDKYALKARMTGYALNIAIGLQVLLGALTTALSAATSGKQTSIAISVLGGISTMVASYLARARGSNEPQLSLTRVKDLEQFMREGEAFKMDHGHVTGHEFDSRLDYFRRRYEELLGNMNMEQKNITPKNTGQNFKISVNPGIV
ncbi:hypothetical protein IW261DRAFT_1002867 [Armillaria novae-zelandiae]|uniref:SMODS and SLOG-associating 2TM effector domain-containing protein n=1 Tax=Armillaria novae-zelandiae TaxID=153914 RepID=A0AA39U4Q0_9AGAR|nr:hypothetical protein IW261DRAFT_1002867 [Armillaria novae-zelandiae]